jgi:hypothetical protein
LSCFAVGMAGIGFHRPDSTKAFHEEKLDRSNG